MAGNVISLDDHRPDPGAFCLSITLTSDGKVTLDLDRAEISTKAQAAWALAQIALAIADIVEHKNTLPDDAQ